VFHLPRVQAVLDASVLIGEEKKRSETRSILKAILLFRTFPKPSAIQTHPAPVQKRIKRARLPSDPSAIATIAHPD
jgi:hypothetical protein